MIQIIKTIIYTIFIFMIAIGASIFWLAVLLDLIEKIKMKLRRDK